MSNILIRKTAHLDRDPFAQSERASVRFDTTAQSRFRDNYDDIFRLKTS